MECAHIICVHTYVCVICSWVEHNCTLFIFFLYTYFTKCMYHSLCIGFPIDGHLGCSHVLALINNAAVNILPHIFWVYTCIELLHMPRVEVLDQRVWIYPVLMDNNKILYSLVQIFLPHNCWSLPCLPLLSSSSFSSSFKFC